MIGTQVDESSRIIFMGVANEHHGNAYQSNEQRGQHACSVHLNAMCVAKKYVIPSHHVIVKKENCFFNILPPGLSSSPTASYIILLLETSKALQST